MALFPQGFLNGNRCIGRMGIVFRGCGKNDLLQCCLELQRRPAIGEDFRLLERLCDPSALDADIVVGIAIATSDYIDSALILPAAAVLNGVRVVQLIAKQDHTPALQRLPILRFWDFVGKSR